MAVYVDDMFKYPMGRFRWMKMSHMLADTEAELHEMASWIGVSRVWFQGDHYDICISKRKLAIARGAIPVTMEHMVQIRKKYHETRPDEDVVEMVQGGEEAPDLLAPVTSEA